MASDSSRRCGAVAPAARRFWGRRARSGRQPPGSDRIFGLLHGLFWLTANLADERPLMLAADDAQWLDEPSLRFLRYLAVRIDELPIALLVAWRSGEPAHAHEHLSLLASDHGSPRLPLAPLSMAGVAAIVRADVAEAEPGFCDVCSELTGGNPLYVTELVGAIKEAGISGHAGESARVARLRPRAIATSVLARLTRRGEAAVELARAVAIAGDGTGLGRASALASLDPAAGAAAADALAEAGLLHASEPLGFVHPLVREAVYNGISPAARAQRHADAARLLHEEGADPELVAAQLLRAPGLGERWAIDVLRLASDRALDRGVPAAAVRYLRRALEERPPRSLRAELLGECGFAGRVTGATDARDLLEQAVELTADAVERARLLVAAGQVLLDQGDMAGAAATFERGLAELAATDVSAPELRAMLWSGREICGRFGAPSTASVDELERLLGGGEPSYPGERALLAFVAFQRAMALEAPRDAVRRSLGARSVTAGTSWTATPRARPSSSSSRSASARTTSW